MVFCTSIHCIDGRIQEPIIKYLKKRYNIDYVDTITEPGPCKILADIERTSLSIHKNKSKLIVISGHHDCAGNPCDKEIQINQINKSI